MLISILFAIACAPADTHPFSVHDMLAMNRISDAHVSPDGKHVLFTVRVTDVEANKGRTDLWMVDVDGTNLVQLTKDEANDSSGRWSSDGSAIWFLSTRSGNSQVWKHTLSTNADEQMTKFAIDVDGVMPFPDGKRLLLAMEVYPDAGREKQLAETAARDEAMSKSKIKARIYETLPIRHWDTWEDKKRSHVFAWTIGGGDPMDLMQGVDGDAPTKPFGGLEEVDISPDSSTVVYTCQLATRDMMWSTNLDLFSVPSDGGKSPTCLTTDNKATDTQPCFSPDGKTLAWLRMERPGYESDRLRIALMNMESGKMRVLTEGWDRSPSQLAWAADGSHLYTTADNFGQKALFTVDVSNGDIGMVVQQGTNDMVGLSGDRVVFAQDTLSSPTELFTCARDGTGVHAITNINADKVAAAKMGEYEQFMFTGAHGDNVWGYLLKPIDFDPAKKYPVAFLIHGGPQGSFGNHFHYRWNPQAYAGAGYAAVMIDFHASTGYGQKFVDAVNHDWGGAPYEDLMKGLDYALAQYKFLDGKHVCALGASFGGYMINWIEGQTDRFTCLVSHDGNLDERMAYYDTEELWFPEWEHGGVPWQNPDGFTKHNPIDFVKNWKTPMLVVHGGLDYRVVDTQGISTFTALQRKGVPSKLLYFPDENHWVQKPQNSILWHDTVIAWIDRWTKQGGGGDDHGVTPAGR